MATRRKFTLVDFDWELLKYLNSNIVTVHLPKKVGYDTFLYYANGCIFTANKLMREIKFEEAKKIYGNPKYVKYETEPQSWDRVCINFSDFVTNTKDIWDSLPKQDETKPAVSHILVNLLTNGSRNSSYHINNGSRNSCYHIVHTFTDAANDAIHTPKLLQTLEMKGIPAQHLRFTPPPTSNCC